MGPGSGDVLGREKCNRQVAISKLTFQISCRSNLLGVEKGMPDGPVSQLAGSKKKPENGDAGGGREPTETLLTLKGKVGREAGRGRVTSLHLLVRIVGGEPDGARGAIIGKGKEVGV